MPEFPPVPLTLEGASVLHQFFRFDWKSWHGCAPGERNKIIADAITFFGTLERSGADAPVRSALYSQLGHKGDLIFVHFRESLRSAEPGGARSAQTALSDFLTPTHSYLSVVELGLYESSRKTYEAAAAKGFAPHSEEWNAEIANSLARGAEAMKPRLYPAVPDCEVPLLLSHGPQARRAGELVHGPVCRAPAHDARARA